MKSIGLLLIFICSVLIGTLLKNKNTEELQTLKEMISFLYHIRNKIEFFNQPIDTIYSTHYTSDKKFREFIDNLSVNGWTFALNNQPFITISEKNKNLLAEYGNLIGTNTKEEQLLLNSHCIKTLETEYEILYSEVPQKNKISMVLSVSAGILLVIILM